MIFKGNIYLTKKGRKICNSNFTYKEVVFHNIKATLDNKSLEVRILPLIFGTFTELPKSYRFKTISNDYAASHGLFFCFRGFRGNLR